MRSSSWTAGRPAAAPWRRPRIRAAPDFLPSVDNSALVVVLRSGYTRRYRWRAALTRRRHRSPLFQRPGASVTSNVGQNYPYTSEPEAERAATIARLVAEREGLAATLAAESSAGDPKDRWWVWK